MSIIKIVKFETICSEAFLNFLDEMSVFISVTDNMMLIDIKSSKNRKLFCDCVYKSAKQYCAFGQKLVIIKSCDLNNNWRKANQHLDPAYMNNINTEYRIIDESVLTVPKFLDDAINAAWEDLQKKQDAIYYSPKNIDAVDAEDIIIDIVGETFVKKTESLIKIIFDMNNLYEHCLNKNFPDYLITSIDIFLKKHYLI